MDQALGSKPPVTAHPIDSILSQMQAKTITMGWDVVCAMEADRINDLLEQQYVTNLSQGSTLPSINATVPVIENISVQFVNLTLAPRSFPIERRTCCPLFGTGSYGCRL